MKQVHTLKSGHTLTLNLASLADADELLSRVAAELRSVRFDLSPGVLLAILGGDKKAALQALIGNDANLVWNIFLSLIASREIKQQLGKCMAVCMLNAAGPDEAIVLPGTFENEKARTDYLPVALEVMKANLIPFFGSLVSALPSQGKSTEPSQK